jgi:putative ABC transport system permease protein
VSMLDRKLWRDLAALRGQVISIALIVAAGISVFVASISTYVSLHDGRDRFYAETRFPQIFATLKRAPLAIVPRLQQIPGIAAVEPRIVRDVIVDWPAAQLPVSARIVSLTHAGEEVLAKLHLRAGTAPELNDARSAVINEAFAEANNVPPGGELRVLLNGLQHLGRRIVAGIRLRRETGSSNSGRPLFRGSVDRSECGGSRIRFEGGVQRSGSVLSPKCRRQSSDRRCRPHT